MNLSRSTGGLLTRSGWNVAHVSELGLSQPSDSDSLAQARRDDRICVTLDADFHALLATSGERRPSVIRIGQQGLNAGALADLLQRLWPRVADALRLGAMVMVTDRTVRIRLLPVLRP